MSNTPYFATYAQDLEQDPFDAMDFVERIAWRITNGEPMTNPMELKNKFEEEIDSLQILCDQFSNKIATLEHQLSADKREYVQQLQRLHDQNGEATNKIKQLDSTMQTVASKVLHLGDQLESVNAPRERANHTLQLIGHFNELMREQSLNSALFTDPDKLLEAADLIQKLYVISQELDASKHSQVQNRIAAKYDEMQNLLLEEFSNSQRDEKKMAAVAKVLSEFQQYSTCVERYIVFLCANFGHADKADSMYTDALQLMKSSKPRIEAIFPQPGAVIQRLILVLFTGKIFENSRAKLMQLKESGERERYLIALTKEFSSCRKLCEELEQLHIGVDSVFLNTLVRTKIFAAYLNSYKSDEVEYLKRQCTAILQRFYEEKQHVKKQIQDNKLQELKRDAQARFLAVENHGGETFLSEDVTINILQEFKNAYARTALLCDSEDGHSASQTEALFDLCLQFLHYEHLDYAVELAIAGITLGEPKTEPPSSFFSVVAQNTTIVHLISKQYADSVQPMLVDHLPEQSSVHKKWQGALRALEGKINVGMERQMNAIIGYIRYVLNSHQKKGDFISDNHQLSVSQGCQLIVRFLNSQVNAIRAGCDGANLSAVLADLSGRFYRLLLTHLQQFYYSMAGGMAVMVDLNEYRRAVGAFKIGGGGMGGVSTNGTQFPSTSAETEQQWNGLHALANLLVMLPENLDQAVRSSQLAEVDRTLIKQFLELRVDYRNLRSVPKV